VAEVSLVMVHDAEVLPTLRIGYATSADSTQKGESLYSTSQERGP